MSGLVRKALLGVALGVLVYVAAIIWVEADRVQVALTGFAWHALGLALALSGVNYLLRFLKWELCLGWLQVRRDAPSLTRRRSLVIYLAGLSMSVTPGKVGEVVRSTLLKASDGVPFSRTAPVVVADRLTDLVALVVLSLVGIARHQDYLPVVAVTLVLVLAAVGLLGSPRRLRAVLHLLARSPRLQGAARRAELLVESSAVVLRPWPLFLLSVLSVLGWGLECIGYWLILHGFPGVTADLALCTFLWSTTTLIGALSFLPGGIGATEGSLAVLIVRLGSGVTQPVAVASTLLIRGATLWFGELVGSLALASFLRSPVLRQRVEETPTEPQSSRV